MEKKKKTGLTSVTKIQRPASALKGPVLEGSRSGKLHTAIGARKNSTSKQKSSAKMLALVHPASSKKLPEIVPIDDDDCNILED